MSENRKAVFDFIVSEWSKSGESPSIRQIMRAFNWNSPNTANYHVKQLVNEGMLIALGDSGKYRPVINHGPIVQRLATPVNLDEIKSFADSDEAFNQIKDATIILKLMLRLQILQRISHTEPTVATPELTRDVVTLNTDVKGKWFDITYPVHQLPDYSMQILLLDGGVSRQLASWSMIDSGDLDIFRPGSWFPVFYRLMCA